MGDGRRLQGSTPRARLSAGARRADAVEHSALVLRTEPTACDAAVTDGERPRRSERI